MAESVFFVDITFSKGSSQAPQHRTVTPTTLRGWGRNGSTPGLLELRARPHFKPNNGQRTTIIHK